MNNNEYKPIIEEYGRATTTKDKLDSLFTFVKMIATNHLKKTDKKIEEITKRQNKQFKWTLILGVIILLGLLFQDQLSFEKIVALLIKAL